MGQGKGRGKRTKRAKEEVALKTSCGCTGDKNIVQDKEFLKHRGPFQNSQI